MCFDGCVSSHPIRGSIALKKTIFTEKCRCCVFRVTKKKATSHRAFFSPPGLIAIFHPKWPSAFPPPRSISVSPYWILTKSRGWGTFGSPIRMSLRTSIGMRWSPDGGDFIKPLPSSNEFSTTRGIPSFWRLSIAVDAAAPPLIATGHHRTDGDYISASGAPL